MTDWDLLTPGIGLTSIGIVGVGVSLSGIAKTFIDGMHAVSLLTMFIGMIFLASGLFKDGFPMSGRAKSATFITLGFLVTFGFGAAVTVSTQVPSIFAYIGLMIIIAIPASVLAVASYRKTPYIKALAVIFIGAALVGGVTYYAFGLVTPRPAQPAEEVQEEPAPEVPTPTKVVNAKILAGASAEGNPDYDPENLSVEKGTVVEWVNEDNTVHTVTSLKDDGKTFDSSTILAGEKWTLDTSKLAEGEYEYFCTFHTYMKAMLTVTAPQAGQTTTPSEGSAGQPTVGGQTPASTPTGVVTVTTVSIVLGSSVPTNNEFFVPETFDTTVGSMVTWVNEDAAPHTATSGVVEGSTPKPDGRFNSNFLNKGESFSFVFDSPGEYDYYCIVHPYMTGKITVK